MLLKLLAISLLMLSTWRLFKSYNALKPYTLCGYHMGDLNREGMRAVLDSGNCEVCKRVKC